MRPFLESVLLIPTKADIYHREHDDPDAERCAGTTTALRANAQAEQVTS